MEPLPQPRLETLMEAYQNGDREAANRLIESVSPALHRYFAIHTADRRHASDLLQDVWLRIHKSRHTYRPGEPVLPWVYAIARHVRVDGYRRREFERREAALDGVAEPAAPAARESRKGPDLEYLLGSLPESQREVISLLKISGLSLEETARVTRSSVGSVKQKAHRAYEKLRSLLTLEMAQ
ncbi:MAG TPA: RNA polymerase sigma factor [Candidatus Sulfopaludibacter sp.]|jgi:RNA polymerase sigma-70 factor (ECF subfamily)|nr:RNA polymerase sigma factor [Candidatus Sulfopaludibacter sp.]